MQGLAAKFKGKKKEEKEEVEEKEKEAEGKGLLSEDGDEEEEEDEEDDDDDEEEDDEDDDDAVAGPAVEGSYDAAEWDHLEVFRSTNQQTRQSNTLINRRHSKTLISSSTRCQRKRRSCLNTSTGVPVTNIRNNSKARVFQAHDLAFKLKPYTEYTFILEEIHKTLPKALGAINAQP